MKTCDPVTLELLDRLEISVPELLAKHPERAAFLPIFVGHAGVIRHTAAAEDRPYVQSRIRAMLSASGFISSDLESQLPDV